LRVPPARRWLDIGCGTGALSQVILAEAEPAEVVGIDASSGFVAHAAAHTPDSRARFIVGDALALPFPADSFDVTVSGLALNFVNDPVQAVREMARVAGPEGVVAAYVWDYAGGMEMMRWFWGAAAALDPAAADLDESHRFAARWHLEGLAALWREAGLDSAETRAFEVPTVFRDFDDYWAPFVAGQGPAPGYVMALPDARRHALRERLRDTLPAAGDGSISLTARAWAVRGDPGSEKS
jgi:SAM-dependent methyltransferase